MKKLSLIVFFALLASNLCAQNSQAPNCFQKLSQRVTTGNRVDLLLVDSNRVSGIVGIFDAELQTLTLNRLQSSGQDDYSYSDIVAVRFPAKRRLKPKWMLLGLVGGALVGGVASEATNNDRGYFSDLATPIFAMLGGLVGLFSGTTIPLIFPGHETVNCR